MTPARVSFVVLAAAALLLVAAAIAVPFLFADVPASPPVATCALRAGGPAHGGAATAPAGCTSDVAVLATLLGERAFATAELCGAAILLGTLVGVPLGVAAGARRAHARAGGLLRNGARVIAYTPALLVAGAVATSSSGAFPRPAYLASLAVLALVAAGVLAVRMSRTISTAQATPHWRFAVAQGLPSRRILTVHAAPVLIPALLVATGRAFAEVLASALLVENVFGWPGLGALAREALADKDRVLVAATLSVIGVMVPIVRASMDAAAQGVAPRASNVRR